MEKPFDNSGVPRFAQVHNLGNWYYYQHSIRLDVVVKQWAHPVTGLTMVDGLRVVLYIDGDISEDLEFVSNFDHLIPEHLRPVSHREDGG